MRHNLTSLLAALLAVLLLGTAGMAEMDIVIGDADAGIELPAADATVDLALDSPALEIVQKDISGGVTADVAVTKLTLGVGQQYRIDRKSLGKNLSFKSSKPKVVAVTAMGVVTAKKKGTAVVTCKSGTKEVGRWKVTVKAAPKKVSLNVKKLTAGKGEKVQLVATTTKNTATQLTWSSSRKSIVQVSADGLIQARKKGKATVTVVTHNGKKASVEVTVKAAPKKVKLSKAKLKLKPGATKTLAATLSPDGAASWAMTWTSSDEAVATVSGKGKVKAVANGTATITATAFNGVSASCKVKVDSSSALTIAFSQIGQESDWRTANTNSVAAAIEGHKGWKFVYSDGQQKQKNQIQALRSFITQDVDYILFTGVVTSGWDEVLTEVNEAGIPLILLDRIPDCADKIEYKAAFGGDFPLEGRRQIQWAAKYLKSIGRTEDIKVAIMEGATGSDAQIGRTKGNLAALKKYPWMEVVGRQTAYFSRDEGQALMESWLKSIDKIDVLIAQNDEMALGAIDAIKAAGKVPGKDIIIVGCDSVKAAFEAIVAGDMNATIECTPLYGPFVVKAIEDLEAGVEYDKTVVHPEEGVYDCVGGIKVEGTTSVLAADVIDERQY